MNNLIKHVNTGNLGAAKSELQEMLKNNDYVEPLQSAADTNSPELIFFAFQKVKNSLQPKDMPLLKSILEKDFSTMIHGEDVVAARRVKNEVSEKVEQLTGISRDLDETGNVTNLNSFLAQLK